jgi:hypothetical protein
MNENIVERVAKAMQESKAWPAVFKAGTAEELSRAAIQAMREPTTEMADTAYEECEGLLFTGELPVKDMWRAMIDKALK